MSAAGSLGVLLALATPAVAQVPCVRLERAFSCADGTSLPIYDDPWGMRGRRGGGAAGIPLGEPGSGRAMGSWWKDERAVQGPDGQVCVVHGTHVHCDGTMTDRP